MRELTKFERDIIISLHKRNYTITDIEKILKISRIIYINIIKKFEKSQTISNISRSGKLSLLKVINKYHFICTAVTNRKDTIKEIIEKFNNLGLTQVNTNIARCILHE